MKGNISKTKPAGDNVEVKRALAEELDEDDEDDDVASVFVAFVSMFMLVKSRGNPGDCEAGRKRPVAEVDDTEDGEEEEDDEKEDEEEDDEEEEELEVAATKSVPSSIVPSVSTLLVWYRVKGAPNAASSRYSSSSACLSSSNKESITSSSCSASKLTPDSLGSS